ncbi:MAG TPA: hypothetical protein VEO00_02765 [Actinomycetota bacterium]|nr:hypothetical protein [Actinomycetota bacterium]
MDRRKMVDAYVLIQVEPGTAGRGVSAEVAIVHGILAADDVSAPTT